MPFKPTERQFVKNNDLPIRSMCLNSVVYHHFPHYITDHLPANSMLSTTLWLYVNSDLLQKILALNHQAHNKYQLLIVWKCSDTF